MKRLLAIGVIFLLIGINVIPSVGGNNGRLNKKDYTKVIVNTKEQTYFFNNSPKVEIINPKNGSRFCVKLRWEFYVGEFTLVFYST